MVRLLPAIFCLLLGLAVPVQAENTGLKRLTLRGDLLGWEAVGKVDLAANGYCTGVLIASDLVLTAAHCLTQAKETESLEGIIFRAGLTDGSSIAERTAKRAVLHPRYLSGGANDLQNVTFDAALIQLSQPIPTATAAPFSVAPLPVKGRAVSVVSYASGRDNALSRQAICAVVGRRQGLLAFDCDVTHGASGAPVFEVSDGRSRIVSLVSAGGLGEQGRIVLGMDVQALISDLKTALRSGTEAFPKPDFAARRVPVNRNGSDTGAKFLRP